MSTIGRLILEASTGACGADAEALSLELSKVLGERSELIEAIKDLDEALCRAGTNLTREERIEDRLRLVTARAIIARCENGK